MLTENQYKELIDKHPEINLYGIGMDSLLEKGTPEYQAEWNAKRAKLYTQYPKYVRCVEWLKTDPIILRPGYEGSPSGNWDPSMDDWDACIPWGILLLARL